MKVHKFENDTFQCTLELILYNYSNQKDQKKVIKHLVEKDFDISKAKQSVVNDVACCTSILKGGISCILFDLDAFKEKPVQEQLVVLSHECAHFKNYVLSFIGEEITKTDRESHLRLSDWAFRKCLSTPHFKKLFK